MALFGASAPPAGGLLRSVQSSRQSANELLEAIESSTAMDSKDVRAATRQLTREFDDVLACQREHIRDHMAKEVIEQHRIRESKWREAAIFAEADREQVFQELERALRDLREVTFERDSIAAEFAALEESFNRAAAVFLQDKVRNAQAELKPATVPAPQRPTAYEAQVHLDDACDVDRLHALERQSNLSHSLLRECRCERDAWKARCLKSEQEAETHKGVIREFEQLCRAWRIRRGSTRPLRRKDARRAGLLHGPPSGGIPPPRFQCTAH